MSSVELKAMNEAQSKASAYDYANEDAISVLSRCGYGPQDIDTQGEPIEEAVQSLLVEAILRSPALRRLAEPQEKSRVIYNEDTVVRGAAVEVVGNIARKVVGEAHKAMQPPTEHYGIEDRAEALEKALKYAVSALHGIETALSMGRGGHVGEDDPTGLSFMGVMVGAVIDRDTHFSIHT